MWNNEIAAVVRFELNRVIHDRVTWLMLGLFALIGAVGAYFYWNALPPRPTGSRLLGDAFAYALALGFHVGIANDRLAGFDRYVTSNFVRPFDLYLGKTASALFFLLGFAAFAFVLGLVFSLGDFQFVTPLILRYIAISLVLLPAVVLAEIIVPARFPILFVGTTMMIAILVYARFGSQRNLIKTLGLDGEFTAGELLMRLTLVLVLTAALYPLYRLRFARIPTARS